MPNIHGSPSIYEVNEYGRVTKRRLEPDGEVPHQSGMKVSCDSSRFQLTGPDQVTCILGRWPENVPDCRPCRLYYHLISAMEMLICDCGACQEQ